MKMALSGLQSSLIRRFTRGGDASGRGRKERRRKGRKEEECKAFLVPDGERSLVDWRSRLSVPRMV